MPPIDSTKPISTWVHFSRRQVNRDERPEPGLHVGEKEDEPVEAAQALAATATGPARRRRRCNDPRATGRSAIVVIDPARIG